MTAPEPSTDPVAAFLTALPAKVRARLNTNPPMVAHIHAATRQGWTVPQLVTETTRGHSDALNIGGIVMHRLEQCARHPPDAPGYTRVHDGCCDGGWRYDETTDPPTVTKCPGRATS